MPAKQLIRIKKRICPGCDKLSVLGRKSGLCYICAIDKVKQNAIQLQHRKGPSYDKWRRGIIRSLEQLP